MNKCGKEGFIRKARAIHGNRYDYSNVNYVRGGNAVAIGCRKHGIFYQAPSNHLAGNGCAYCNLKGGDDVYNFTQKLNRENGWELVGGNQEFKIDSGLSRGGKYAFDGADLKRLIFFEYNDTVHDLAHQQKRDLDKKEALRALLAREGLAGKATYITYNSITEHLVKETL